MFSESEPLPKQPPNFAHCRLFLRFWHSVPKALFLLKLWLFSVLVVVSVVAISELSADAETPTEVEAVGDKELLFTFSPVVQAVNVPAINIMLIIIAIFFFICSSLLSSNKYIQRISNVQRFLNNKLEVVDLFVNRKYQTYHSTISE